VRLVLRTEHRVSHILQVLSATELHSPAIRNTFCLGGRFGLVFACLFGHTGFELRTLPAGQELYHLSSRSLVIIQIGPTWTEIPLPLPPSDWDHGCCHHAPFLDWNRVLVTVLLG
jgi:hypothetical protein